MHVDEEDLIELGSKHGDPGAAQVGSSRVIPSAEMKVSTVSLKRSFLRLLAGVLGIGQGVPGAA
jgi:hypothetical protein